MLIIDGLHSTNFQPYSGGLYGCVLHSRQNKHDANRLNGAISSDYKPKPSRNDIRLSTVLGKRDPYAFGLGKRDPYAFGLGKRDPYAFGLGKRDPYSFGMGR